VTVQLPDSGDRRRRQAAATRRQLLDAACRVFEDRGYRAASVGAITERAKTAHGTFYLYFSNKDDVFCHVIRSVIAGELVEAAAVPRGASPRQYLERGLTGFVEVYSRHRGLWEALLEGVLQSPRVQELWLELRRGFVDQIAASLRAQQGRGEIRSLDPVLAAHALTAMTEWLAFTHLALGEPGGDARDTEAMVATLTDLWYHALYGQVDRPVGA
jgi:AcrR family transcriptional regulator